MKTRNSATLNLLFVVVIIIIIINMSIKEQPQVSPITGSPSYKFSVYVGSELPLLFSSAVQFSLTSPGSERSRHVGSRVRNLFSCRNPDLVVETPDFRQDD